MISLTLPDNSSFDLSAYSLDLDLDLDLIIENLEPFEVDYSLLFSNSVGTLSLYEFKELQKIVGSYSCNFTEGSLNFLVSKTSAEYALSIPLDTYNFTTVELEKYTFGYVQFNLYFSCLVKDNSIFLLTHNLKLEFFSCFFFDLGLFSHLILAEAQGNSLNFHNVIFTLDEVNNTIEVS